MWIAKREFRGHGIVETHAPARSVGGKLKKQAVHKLYIFSMKILRFIGQG
jgi:hypothetical protein